MPDPYAMPYTTPDDPDDALVVGGRFELGRLLGSGATSAVFEAHDREGDETVALRMLHPHLSTRDEEVARFLDEVTRSPAAPHPNLVCTRVSGVHVDGGLAQAWMAIDLAPGVTLAESIASVGPLSIADSLTAAGGVLAGLVALHTQGLVHRDVSPNNLMILRSAGRGLSTSDIRLIDYGLADAPGRVDRDADGLVVGSVDFISPEQARGVAVDFRADLYAVAAVLFFCITGQVPFPRATTELTLRAQVNSPPPLPSALRPGISRELDGLVARGMSKRASTRFESAVEMLEVVTELQQRERPDASSEVLAPTSVMPIDTVRTRVAAPRDAATERFATSSVRSTVAARRSSARPTGTTATTHSPRHPRGRANPFVVLAITLGAAVVGWGVVAAVLQSPPAPTVAVPSVAPPTVDPAPVAPVVPDTPVRRQLPNLISLPIAEAQQSLAALGLVSGETTAVDGTQAANTIVASSPPAGDWLAPGDLVQLTYASGSNSVPDVSALSRDAATAAVQDAGFAVSTATVEDPIAVTGAVVGSTPAVGARLVLGSTVTVLIAFTTPHPTPVQTSAPPTTATPLPTPPPSVVR